MAKDRVKRFRQLLIEAGDSFVVTCQQMVFNLRSKKPEIFDPVVEHIGCSPGVVRVDIPRPANAGRSILWGAEGIIHNDRRGKSLSYVNLNGLGVQFSTHGHRTVVDENGTLLLCCMTCP